VKLIVAIIQERKLPRVLGELNMNEIYLKTMSIATGYGPPEGALRERTRMFRLEIAVNDSYVRPTLDAILSGAYTGRKGDGKIFIFPLEECIRIRNGETGSVAIG
jgi:nitrogen regulatory protein PII